jgi:chromate reductase, NAD(P)H dehydrogenase (quinone)
MRVLAISGSLRRESHNTKLLRNAEELLGTDVDFELYDELESVPPYNEDRDGVDEPSAVAEMRARIEAADALLIATPEYNSSIPGQLKNAVDWASRPVRAGALWGKPAVVIGASTGFYGGVWAQAELRKVLSTAGARVVDAEVAVSHADTRFDANGRLVDQEIREELHAALVALRAEVDPQLAAAAA